MLAERWGSQEPVMASTLDDLRDLEWLEDGWGSELEFLWGRLLAELLAHILVCTKVLASVQKLADSMVLLSVLNSMASLSATELVH